KELNNDESLLVQSGKPVGKFKTHDEAPRVLIANSNLVGQWNNYDQFNRLERLGLTMYGQMTAGSWIYIGSQGIVQGTFETLAAAKIRTDTSSARCKRWRRTSKRCSRCKRKARSHLITATTFARRRKRPALRMRSISPGSFRNTFVRFSAKDAVRSAGSR